MLRNTWGDDRGAMDLPSVMVTVIIIGILATLVGLKVIPLIPWAQDTAAKHSLSKVVDAQNMAQIMDGSYVSEERLIELGFLSASDADKFETSALRNPWTGTAQAGAASGNHFYASITSGSGKTFTTHNGGDITEAPSSGTGAQPSTGVMVTRWDTSLPGCSSITIPMTGVQSGATIDWGDGAVEPATDKPSHAYSSTGQVEVVFTGKFNRFSFADTLNSTTDPISSKCLIAVPIWSGTETKDLAGAFYFATNLESVPAIPRGVEDLSAAFGMADFNGDISQWDTSEVRTMTNMFVGNPSFNQPIGGWDTSKVTDMSSMFVLATGFNQDIGDWNTSNVTTMNAMFAYTDVFNADLSRWDTSKVTDMADMFGVAKSFNADIGQWDVSNVTDMRSVFHSAGSFNKDLGSWNTSSVTNMASMFYAASVFDQDLSGWTVDNVIEWRNAFADSAMQSKVAQHPVWK